MQPEEKIKAACGYSPGRPEGMGKADSYTALASAQGIHLYQHWGWGAVQIARPFRIDLSLFNTMALGDL